MTPTPHSIARRLFLVAPLVLGSCGDVGQVMIESEAEARPPTWEEFLSQVYVEPETGVYIVNGDTPVVDSKLLYQFYEQLLVEYYQTKDALIVNQSGGVDTKWNDADKMNITYCVSSTFGTRYSTVVQAMADAAAAWQAVSAVRYVYVSSQDGNCTTTNNNVVFNVSPINANGQYLARSFFPYDARSARSVMIDGTAFTSTPPPTLTGILRHELGHTLGYRHEHTRPEAGTCYEDSSWRPLTPYDSSSVMHYPQCNGTGDWTLVLTAQDAQGAALLYGSPNAPPPPPPPPGGSETVRTLTGSVAQAAQVPYGPFNVTAGTTFEATMTGTGDPDLYVRWGAAPTQGTYTCRPYVDGPEEVCRLTVPAGTTSVYLMIRGFTAATYSVTVRYTEPSGGPSPGTPSTQTYSGSLTASQTRTHGPLSVLAGSVFDATMTGTGDPDLYVRWGSAPTTSTYSCRPYIDGPNESCHLTVPAGTTSAYIMVRGYTAATYSVTVNYTKP